MVAGYVECIIKSESECFAYKLFLNWPIGGPYYQLFNESFFFLLVVPETAFVGDGATFGHKVIDSLVRRLLHLLEFVSCQPRIWLGFDMFLEFLLYFVQFSGVGGVGECPRIVDVLSGLPHPQEQIVDVLGLSFGAEGPFEN